MFTLNVRLGLDTALMTLVYGLEIVLVATTATVDKFAAFARGAAIVPPNYVSLTKASLGLLHASRFYILYHAYVHTINGPFFFVSFIFFFFFFIDQDIFF